MEFMLSLDPSPQHNTSLLLAQLKGHLRYVKIGHILFSQGIEQYREVLKSFQLFIDFKFLDIPNTVRVALKNYKQLFPTLEYYTIHGSAEDNMIQSCIDSGIATPLSVIALSSNKNSTEEKSFLFQVERNIKLGISHFVCPPHQVQSMKQHFGTSLIIFVPGIRNHHHHSDDHVSTMDLASARQLGVNFAIMGRPILESKDPITTLQELSLYQ